MPRIEMKMFTLEHPTKQDPVYDDRGKEVVDPSTEIKKTKPAVRVVFQKDLDEYLEKGYVIKKESASFKTVSVEFKQWVDEKIDRVTPRNAKSEEEKGVDAVVQQVMSCTVEELSELNEMLGLGVLLAKYKKKADKQAALIKAIQKQEEDSKDEPEDKE